MVTWRSGALEWAYSRKKVRHSTSPFVVGWTKKMEKRRKQKRPSGKQKEKWSRKCGNIAPRNCAQKLIRSEIWRNFRRFRLNRNRTRMSTDFEFWKMVWKWRRFAPRRYDSPENHNFPGTLFLESRTLLFLASSEVSFGYAPLYILSDCLSVLCVIPWYWCGNR